MVQICYLQFLQNLPKYMLLQFRQIGSPLVFCKCLPSEVWPWICLYTGKDLRLHTQGFTYIYARNSGASSVSASL